jgi:hypothetical protein
MEVTMCKPADRPTPQAVLAQRFGARDCDWCGRGAAGHTVTFDTYGDPVVRCDADDEDDPLVVRAYNRRLLTGGLR